MSTGRPETVAVLPVKRWDAAKQRLAEDFGKGTRRALVEAMVTDVLIALRRSKKVDLTLVITKEPGVEALAHGYDADAVHDTAAETHSAAAALGVQRAVERGARRVLLIPGDCPAMDPKEVDALLARPVAEDGEVVIIPDRHGTGTNGLLLTPPQIIQPAFGPGSRERHERLAAEAGASCVVEEVRSIVLDVDTAEDLDVVREALGEGVGNAAHTRGMLSRLARR
jgi:2-phospho-L-lactate guanylyltransferase